MWNPTQYDKFKSERSQPFFDLMDMVHPFSGEAIDLGCGTGELTSEFHERFKPYNTLGIDSSAEMLSKAKNYAHNNLLFKNETIENWNEKNKYDTIISNAALQWCPDHPKLFEKLRVALKPLGQIAIQMPMNHEYATHVIAEEMSHQIFGNKNQKNVLKSHQYAKLLYQNGFSEQQVMVKVYVHILPSREDVIEWVKGTTLTSFKNKLSPEEYEKFLDNYRQRLFKVLPDEKPFFYPFKRIFIWGRI